MSDDLEAALGRARAAGVEQLVHIGCRLEAFDPALALARAHPSIFTAIGIHPHDAKTADEAAMTRLEQLAAANRGEFVVAIGETGLDYYYDFSPREAQRETFARHIDLARRLDMPLVLHIRDAHDEAFEIVDACAPRENPGIVHCFTGTPTEARGWLDRGWHVSFSGIATFPSATPVLEAARACPADRILIETDAPFLAPKPMRGRKNEPAFVSFTCAILAAARGVSAEQFAAETTANTRRVLNLPQPASTAPTGC